MDLLRPLLTAVSAGGEPGPFALLRRGGADHLDVLRGELAVVDRIAEIPLPTGSTGPRTLAVVPFRQLAEHGLPCVDDGAPLECLRVTDHDRVPVSAALAALPTTGPRATGGHFDIDDDQYAETVRTVLREEIGRGEGANFVLHRTYTATLDGPPVAAGLAALRRLLRDEPGAYWTFLVHTGARTLVGATPERHVSAEGGTVRMNPISGTHRLGPAGPDQAGLLRFLADAKETDELYMVLDEELKMMSRVAAGGTAISGPRLNRMAHLVHTEYLLDGRGDADVRDILRETMFAPTVTGSPLRSALRVIARHERRGRRYYAGVCALLGRDGAGRQTLDAPILIRTAELTADGVLRVPVGATLVRHSTPHGEVAETHTKAAGILAAFGLRTLPVRSPAGPPSTSAVRSVDLAAIGALDPGSFAALAGAAPITAALADRNAALSRFWLAGPAPRSGAVAALTGRSALVVDAEDAFADMLAALLRALGLAVTVRPWDDLTGPAAGNAPPADAELLVIGPGPGDPGAGGGDGAAGGKMAVLRGLIAGRLAARRPLLAVCLGHQLLAGLLGLALRRRDDPYQGLARTIDLFGQSRRVGFYSTFTAVAGADELASAYGPVRLARDPADHSVHALRAATFTGLQFHPESVLSRDGLDILRDVLADLLAPTRAAPSTR
ncbi:chorismate-binding protein [Frankia sp. AgKG'84/4]